MRDQHFRHTQKRPQVYPAFLRRLHSKRFRESVLRADSVIVDKDPVAEVSALFAFARANPDSPESRSIRYFLNAFDDRPVETPKPSVSDLVVKDLMNYAAAKQLLTLRFVDECACQIEGGIPCISAFNEGHDGAVDEILSAHFSEAAADGHPQAEDRLSMHKAAIWANGVAKIARADVNEQLVRLDRHIKDQLASQKLG